jgi:hypothetical protein
MNLLQQKNMVSEDENVSEAVLRDKVLATEKMKRMLYYLSLSQ